MNWFQHDTDSTQDAKIKKLLIRYGAIGYAVYFHCLELIASDISESNLTFELEHDSEIIASNLFIKGTAEKSGIEIVQQVMRYIIDLGLFSEANGHVFCLKLLKRINMSMTSNPTFRTAINNKKEEYHDTVMIRHDNVMARHETLPTLPTLPTNITKDKRTPTARATFKKPTIDEVTAYCTSRRNSVDPGKWLDHYESNGWVVGKTKMKDWQASIRTWERSNYENAGQKKKEPYKFNAKDFD